MLSRLWLFCCAAPLLAQAPGDSTVTDTLAPGIVHTYVVRAAGPLRAHIVRVDWRSGAFRVRSVRALDSLRGREKLTDMVRRAAASGHDVRVAINADFFDLKSGESVNNQVSGGEIWKALAMSGTPGGPVKTARGQFGVTRSGKPVIDRFVFTGTLRGARAGWALDGVNATPSNGQGLVLWLPAANGRARDDSLRRGQELRVKLTRSSWRDSLVLVPSGRVGPADTTPLAPNEGALVAYGAAASRLDSIARHRGALSAHASWIPAVGPLDELIGGWPVILRDDVPMVVESATRELTNKSNADVRHPRSLVGFDADTSHLYFIAIDGRSSASVGTTLAEAADLLRTFRITYALNLDGGGSTTLLVNGRIVNAPSDKEGERPIANAIFVESRPAKR